MTMQITVRYFAGLREALCMDAEALSTQAPTLGALRRELAARGGRYAARAASAGHEYVPAFEPGVEVYVGEIGIFVGKQRQFEVMRCK